MSLFCPGFTPAGFALIVFSLVILIRSLYFRNVYEILLSAGITIIWIIFYAAGMWGKRKLSLLKPMWKPPYPFTAKTQEETLISGLDYQGQLFFRLHVIIKGRFLPSGESVCPVFLETAVMKNSNSTSILLSFPMAGIFHGEVSLRLKDIFGLFSFHCGIDQKRSLNILCAPGFKKQLRMDPQSGAEDRRSKSSDDEERYYMREYSPGDRLRDINWKSSERIDTLITRISPDTNEKICRIEVFFRNYGPPKPSLQALWLLDRAKAQLSGFLRYLNESDENFVFTVHTAQGVFELEDTSSLEAFLEDLSGFRFSPPSSDYFPLSSASLLYVFSTACDESLEGFLSACYPKPAFLFLTEPSDDKLDEILFVRSFPASGCFPSPGWLFHGKAIKSSSPASAVHVERNYCGVRL